VRRRKIYRVLFFTAWIVVVGGITSLLIAANGKRVDHLCKGIIIELKGESAKYIRKEDILNTVERVSGGSVLNKAVSAVNLPALEKTIEKNEWIQNAELYFDSKDQLNISIWERTPIARVFTTAGTSFYIDSFGQELKLLPNEHLRLQVVTGFTPARKWNSKDSAQFQSMKEVVTAINSDPFWNAQVGQVDITHEGNFELMPVVGDHVIKLGGSDNIKSKLHRLYVFYKQVLAKAGFNKYAALNVAYEGQVIGVKKGPVNKIDSIQLQQNIENLLKTKEAEAAAEETKLQAQDSAAHNQQPVIINEDIKPLLKEPVPMKTESNPIGKPVSQKLKIEEHKAVKKKKIEDTTWKAKLGIGSKVENEY
jgi:cell division protein FtsQ